MALGWKKEYLRYKAYFLNVQNIYKTRADIKMFLEILLSLATISIFGVFALRPTVLTIAGLYQEIKTKKETLAQMETKIASLESAQATLNEQSAILPILEISVPLKPKPEDFVRQIRGLANQNSVKVAGFSIEETILKGRATKNVSAKTTSPFAEGAGAMGFSGGVSGNYANLLSFLQDLGNLRMPVYLSLFNLTVAKTESGQALNLAFSGVVPYLETK